MDLTVNMLIYAIVGETVIFGGAFFMLYNILAPVWPYVTAYFKKGDIMVVLGSNSKMKLMPAKYSAQTIVPLDKKIRSTYLLRKPRTTYSFGAVRASLHHDGWGVVMDPDLNEAVAQLKEAGYETYEELDQAMKDGDINANSKIMVKAVKEVPVKDVLDYVSEVRPQEVRALIDEKTAEVVEQYTELLKKDNGMNSNTLIILAIIGCVVLGAFFVFGGGASGIKIPGLTKLIEPLLWQVI